MTAVLSSIRRILLGALIAAALLLVAFGPRGVEHAPPGRVVVTYWEKWTDFEGEAMRRLCALFNDTVGAEKGIYVDYVVTTQIDLKTLIATAGGDPPDLAGLWPHNVSSFASKKALTPLSRAADAGIDEQKILPVYYRQCFYHDTMYAVPLTPWSLALYYNQDIFDEFADQLAAAGYSADRPPRTLEELADYASIMQRRDSEGRIEMLGFLPGVPETIGWYWLTWGLWCGGDFFDPASQRFRIDTPEYICGYQWVRDFSERIGVREILRFESSLANFNSPDNPFMIGRLVMVQQGPWFANMIRQYAPEIRYGAAPFPTHDGSEISYCGQDVLVIPAGAHHPDEAWAFIEWLYNAGPVNVPSGKPQPQRGYEYYEVPTSAGVERRPMPAMPPIEWLCWIHYKNSPLREVSEAFRQTHPNPALAVHDRAARSPQARTEPPLPNWSELLGEFLAAYRDIWAGKVDVAERLRRSQQRIDELSELARRNLERYGEVYP
ncbi:MAG: extracellular solute-binding protein [Planctomycetota bacterium]|nr:MAG: extracellular solute-binding protein [Planctomycetota bacterium]